MQFIAYIVINDHMHEYATETQTIILPGQYFLWKLNEHCIRSNYNWPIQRKMNKITNKNNHNKIKLS